MTKIKVLADEIADELNSAKEYAEEYLTFKAKNNGTWANRYKEMATDELKHAGYIHDRAVEEIEELRKEFQRSTRATQAGYDITLYLMQKGLIRFGDNYSQQKMEV